MYLNTVWTRILQRSKKEYYKYKNKIFPNNSHIYIRYFDAASSYPFPYTMTGSRIPKCDCILNCCSGFHRMKAVSLESSKTLENFFLVYVLKTIYVFQNIYKCLIHGLIPFDYRSVCKLCEITPDKVKRGKYRWIIFWYLWGSHWYLS